MTPQSVTDALNALQVQKDLTDAAAATKTQKASALVTAQTEDSQAAATLAQAGADLTTKRQQLEAILDSFYTVGGTIPSTP